MMRFLISACTAMFLMAGAYAQLATTTALVGTVTDTSGQTVPGAKVTAVNPGTGDTYNTMTNDQGYYNIQFVRDGTYNIMKSRSRLIAMRRDCVGSLLIHS